MFNHSLVLLIFTGDYSNILVPLTCLTQKNTPWNFTSDCQQAFLTLKCAFTMAPVLAQWELDCQIIVETDASDYALAAILSIQDADSEVHPVAFNLWIQTQL